MQLVIPASPSRLAGLRRAVRAYLRGVKDEVADEVVLALDEVATNAVLYGSSGVAGGACGCCAGWWMRCALNGSGSVPG